MIVEGVTSRSILTLLRDMGHRYLQGYVLSRPLELAQLAAGQWADLELPAGVQPPPSVPTARVPSDGAPSATLGPVVP